jgi:hypothetical protein
MFKSFDPKILEIHDKHDDCIHPCTTRPPNTNENIFHVLFFQEISTIKAFNYLLNLPDHIIDYDFTYIYWYNLSTWANEQEIKEMNQNGDDNVKNENFETFIVDENLENSEYIIYTIFKLTINEYFSPYGFSNKKI